MEIWVPRWSKRCRQWWPRWSWCRTMEVEPSPEGFRTLSTYNLQKINLSTYNLQKLIWAPMICQKHLQYLSSPSIYIWTVNFLRILVMELFEGFHPEWEKCTWKEAADTCEKPGNHYCKNKFKLQIWIQILMQQRKPQIQIQYRSNCKSGGNHIMPKADVEEVTTVQTVSPQGAQGRA